MTSIVDGLPGITTAAIVAGSRYEQDEGQPSSLLGETCREQWERLHALNLMAHYLAGAGGGRRRAAIIDEEKALHALYEAVWAELELAFPTHVVLSAREWVEALLSEKSHGRAQLEILF